MNEPAREKRCPHCGKHPELQAHRKKDGPALKGAICFDKFDYLWERDLLGLAHDYPMWRKKANELGFRDEKIDKPWTFPDEGRFVNLGKLTPTELETLWGPFVRQAPVTQGPGSAAQMGGREGAKNVGADADGLHGACKASDC